MNLKRALLTMLFVLPMAAAGPGHWTCAQSVPKRIDVVAKRYAFSPDEVTLQRSVPVVIVLKSVDVAHGIRFRDLGIEAKAGKGQTTELAFTPDKVGTFVGHCSVFCGAGHGEMTLTIHVVE